LPVAFGLFLLILNYLNFFVLPTNDNINALTFYALAAFFILAGIAAWIDRKRG
jgi:hypothetical protein